VRDKTSAAPKKHAYSTATAGVSQTVAMVSMGPSHRYPMGNAGFSSGYLRWHFGKGTKLFATHGWRGWGGANLLCDQRPSRWRTSEDRTTKPTIFCYGHPGGRARRISGINSGSPVIQRNAKEATQLPRDRYSSQ